MLNKKLFNKKLLLIAILSAGLLIQSSDAFAWRRFPRRIRRPHCHRKVITIPDDYISISIGGLKFCYGNDAFYRRRARRYVVVRPYGYVVVPSPVVYIIK